MKSKGERCQKKDGRIWDWKIENCKVQSRQVNGKVEILWELRCKSLRANWEKAERLSKGKSNEKVNQRWVADAEFNEERWNDERAIESFWGENDKERIEVKRILREERERN